MWNINEFAAISIRMASPERIREWSHGEVKKPETINYRTLRPEIEGLFCEMIFGSTKDWECYCGKFKSIRYKGVICDRCQVEVTHSKVRRERMGHIDLVAPVSHIWYFKGIPSKIGVLLNLTGKELERVLYFQDYIVIDPGETPLKKKQLLNEEEYEEARAKYGKLFKAEMGAEAIRELLAEIDVQQLRREIRESLKFKQSKQDERRLIRQLTVVEALANSGNRPEWMILTVLPVIPPDLRPMVQLDGGRFATSDLNDLYRRVLNRNNRLRRLVELRAPQIIIRNEKRMLQEAVDALLDNGRRGRPVKGTNNNRVLKSLSDMLKGKQGRFRQNLLGKRVDYSGRSVIVVGPELKLNQCGLPKKMALELFKPFIMKELVKRGLASNIKAAKKMVERAAAEVWEVIEDVIKDHPVLLNRAPTLHRLGIQAFQPVLIEGKAIRLHPLVCVAFNADFDGDQMAVHVPLSQEAIIESKILMMADRNILSPASGKPIVTPTQDIVLGVYYLTKERESAARAEKLFATKEECLYALEAGWISLQGRVRVCIGREESGRPRIVETTPGRIIFNEVLPEGFGFVNRTISKSVLGGIIDQIFRRYGETITARTANSIKELGFRYATRSGISIGIEDMKVPGEKEEMIAAAKEEVNKINEQYANGVITEQERYSKIIDLWTSTTDEVAKVMFDQIESDKEGFNPIYIMADSGARGSKAQIKQLAGMRGLMADPFGKIRETPITSNFREGLSVIEFFQSTTGARKGLTDTALKTANAGYLTRRLVDVAQDIVVTEEDCKTTRGIVMEPLRAGDEISESLADRVLGRFVAEDVEDPREEGKLLFKAGDYIDDEAAQEIRECGLEEIKIRSVLTCDSETGVCRRCYGRDLATGRLVEIGEAVGVIAAQSIGEPGTQLTLRTFHVGGTASADDTYLRSRFTGVVTSLPRTKVQKDGSVFVVEEGDYKGKRVDTLVVRKDVVFQMSSRGARSQMTVKRGVSVSVKAKDGAKVEAETPIVLLSVHSRIPGTIKAVKKDFIVIKSGKKEQRVDIPLGMRIVVAAGQKISEKDPVAERVFAAPFAAKLEVSEKNGAKIIRMVSLHEENMSAVSEKGVLVEAPAMMGAEPKVKVGDVVERGNIIALNPSFKPILAEMDGRVEFRRVAIQKEGNEQIVVKPSEVEGTEQGALIVWRGSEYFIGPDDHLEVNPGEKVEVGQRLSRKHTSRTRGVVHVVRRYVAKSGAETAWLIRVVENADRKALPYLRYTRTSAGTGKSKALSKVKKQNIRLISKCHVVRNDLFEKSSSTVAKIENWLARHRAKRIEEAGYKSEVFDTVEYELPSDQAVREVSELEEKALAAGEALTVESGELIVKLFSDFLKGPKESGGEKAGMTKDITGGLPRVEELFELRKPKSTPAILAPFGGKISIGAKFRKERKVDITGEDGSVEEIEIPPERHLIVENGAEVAAGDLLTDGPVDVHEMLKVRPGTDVQRYIVGEIQDVYRMQGVEINDKHVEVIVRQMMKKVQIEEPGDTEFLPDELVDRSRMLRENRRVREQGKKQATYHPVLLGITKASKFSESFISAASFQETTWALTQAAVAGKRDDLLGLKENVIIGHLIPAGTGARRYRDGVVLELPEAAEEEGEESPEKQESPSSPVSAGV
ncbi:MAG: DNA-directed RNA polymerase subunit beta' [Candidatus Hydrogenedentota bacterium]|nr:MAG: DNA-directed RNA polymerase subunit beta' [Candidatus Hydrogenedentota bacterium]